MHTPLRLPLGLDRSPRGGWHGGLPGAVELQRRWHALSAAEREGYEAEARADKARFDREMLAQTPAFASLAMFRCSDGWLNEVYPLAACPQRPDAETVRDVRLLFSEVFKELHAEVPPSDAQSDPPLLLAGAVRTEEPYEEEFYDDLEATLASLPRPYDSVPFENLESPLTSVAI